MRPADTSVRSGHKRPCTTYRYAIRKCRNAIVSTTLPAAGQIPIRALSPALYIGSVQVAENETVNANLYRFFAMDEAVLKIGAPIRLGWVGHPPPKGKAKFHYETPKDSVSR